jgi:deoxyribodipyrimidine photo-lyase
MQKVNIIWFRRDLRLCDNHALHKALQAGLPVLPIFIFDKNILDKLEDKADARVQFIYNALQNMQQKLLQLGSTLQVFYGTPIEVFNQLTASHQINTVFTNHDYEPYATERDSRLQQILQQQNIQLHTFKDQVIFEKSEVVKDDGKPYTVFTPFSKKWKATLANQHLQPFETESFFNAFYQQAPQTMPTLQSMGFKPTNQVFPQQLVVSATIKAYAAQRDIPSIAGTSKLGVHLRFGTISIRQLANYTKELSETFLNELIWRDFYHTILWHFPHVGHGKAFRPEYDTIEWRHDAGEFEKWCNGQTGYPIVDAGMRELNATGFMHNRVRMIVASFLSKHLLLDWRLGEAYFAKKLLDFDLAANNGGWQWAAGSGCDAAPYFRIFNPYLQTQRFDAKMEYIKKWVPEYQEFNYPKPIIQHEVARKRCLEVYAKALKKDK